MTPAELTAGYRDRLLEAHKAEARRLHAITMAERPEDGGDAVMVVLDTRDVFARTFAGEVLGGDVAAGASAESSIAIAVASYERIAAWVRHRPEAPAELIAWTATRPPADKIRVAVVAGGLTFFEIGHVDAIAVGDVSS